MSCRTIGLDLSLLRQAISIAREGGLSSLEELARLGAFLEKAFYVADSLRSHPDHIEFEIENPPLRMGAFRAARLLWDGESVPPERCVIAPGRDGPRPFSEVSELQPLTIPSGRRTTIMAAIACPSESRHTVRLELQSIAIPPVVWLEFYDRARAVEAPRP